MSKSPKKEDSGKERFLDRERVREKEPRYRNGSRSRSVSRSRSTSRSRRHERKRRYSSSRSRDSRSRSGSRRNLRQTGAPPGKVLGIFGLSGDTRESDLRDEFGRFGDLEDCVLIMDRRTGLSKRFGFVYFKREEDASKAKESLNGMQLHGNQVRIDFSYTKKAHSPTPGRYMGKTSGRSHRSSRYTPYSHYGSRRSPPRSGYDYGYDRRSRDYYDRYDDRYDDYDGRYRRR